MSGFSHREGIEEILPTEAHSLATDRLYVSITHSESGTNHIVSTFPSREELIKVRTPLCKHIQPVLSVSNMVINVYDCFTPLFLSSLQFSALTTINDTMLYMSCYLTAHAS